MFVRMRHRFAVIVSTTVVVSAAAMAQDRPETKSQVPDGINKQFANPDLKPDEFIDRFERESREVFAQRDAIAAVVGLEPGMEVADVGAGTGLFTLLFAEQVRPDGKVYAVDIAPAFLKLIAERAGEKGLSEVVATVQGSQDATNLEPRSVDVVFICDTYHHFENPRLMLRSIRQALRPGGKLVLVEFDKEKADTAFTREHIRANKETFIAEITNAGFEPLDVESAPELGENFIAVFKKVRPAAQGKRLQQAKPAAGPGEAGR